MCIIDDRSDWFWDCTTHSKVLWIEDIRWMTLRQVICKVFNTTSWDIRNSPWLYGLCWEPIQDFNVVVDDSFLFLHITKRWKKSKDDEFFRPKWEIINFKWKQYKKINLTIEEYTFCSDYRLIVKYNPKDNDDV